MILVDAHRNIENNNTSQYSIADPLKKAYFTSDYNVGSIVKVVVYEHQNYTLRSFEMAFFSHKITQNK